MSQPNEVNPAGPGGQPPSAAPEAPFPEKLPPGISPVEALAAMVAAEPARAARKLSFYGQCSAFYALHAGASRTLVAKAFGVTQSTVSLLANCLAGPGRDGKWRYAGVAEEFNRLGEKAFAERYYTEETHLRLMRIKMNIAEAADQRGSHGPNPNADKYSTANYGVFEIDGDCYRIDWVTREFCGEGWHYAPCDEAGTVDDPSRYTGHYVEETRADRPFRTSAAAYDAVYEAYGQISPRAKPGRQRI